MPLLGPLFVALAFLAGSACRGSSPPTGPTPTGGALAGIWTGTLSSAGATESVRLELVEAAFGAGSIITGTYVSRDAAGSAADSTGTVAGASLDGRVSLTLKPSRPPPCATTQPVPAGDVLLTMTAAENRLLGDGVAVNCGGDARVTAQFTK